MPKKERDIVAWIFRNFINSLKPRRFQGDLMGTDHFGNKYFEIPSEGNRAKRARYFEPPGKDKEDGFDKELPAEWEAWLRGRRGHPPTDAEIKANYQLMLDKKKKALEIENKFKGTKIEEQTVASVEKQMKSFPKYKEYEHVPGEKQGSSKD